MDRRRQNHHERLVGEGWIYDETERRYTKTVGGYDLSIVRARAVGFGFIWKAMVGSEQKMTGDHQTRVGAMLDACAWAWASERNRQWQNP